MWRPSYQFTDPDGWVTDVHVHFRDTPTIADDLYLWKQGGTWWMRSTYVGCRLKNEGGACLTTVFADYGGSRYYTDGGLFLWKNGGLWVRTGHLGRGYGELWRATDPVPASPPLGQYVGDTWWSLKTPGPGGAPAGVYSARGQARGTTEGSYLGEEITIEWEDILTDFDGWTKSDAIMAGLYEHKGSAVGDKFVGWRSLNDSATDDTKFTEVLAMYSDRGQKFVNSLGRVLCNIGDDWVIVPAGATVVDPVVGYWKGPAYSTANNETFKGYYSRIYTGPLPRPDPSGYSISTVTYSSVPAAVTVPEAYLSKATLYE